jgi:hypothetical protein
MVRPTPVGVLGKKCLTLDYMSLTGIVAAANQRQNIKLGSVWCDVVITQALFSFRIMVVEAFAFAKNGDGHLKLSLLM